MEAAKPLQKAKSKKAPGSANGQSDSSTEGAVGAFLAKRLRNAKKRLRGLEELQAKVDEGKELNPDQVRRRCRAGRADHARARRPPTTGRPPLRRSKRWPAAPASWPSSRSSSAWASC
jgi:hypothetical protein